jgi:uncharacterized membrane protein YkoI
MTMTIRKVRPYAAFAALAITAAAMSPLLAHARTRISKANIGIAEASAIALRAFPGTIMKQELEHERGGSGLRYSFDMRKGKSWREVGIDAVTGRVLENTHEGANPRD